MHYDFFVQNSEKFSYVLVLEDDLSHFVEICSCESTDHCVVVHDLVD